MNSLIFRSAASASGSFAKRNKVAVLFAGRKVYVSSVANISRSTKSECESGPGPSRDNLGRPDHENHLSVAPQAGPDCWAPDFAIGARDLPKPAAVGPSATTRPCGTAPGLIVKITSLISFSSGSNSVQDQTPISLDQWGRLMK